MERAVLLGLSLATALYAGQAAARTRIIVLAPAPTSSAILLNRIAESVAALSAADRLLVYVARPMRQIADIARPSDPSMNNARIRAALAAQFTPVREFLAAPPAPSGPEPSGNLTIPFVVEELGRNVLPSLPEKSADILFMGSWLFFDRRDSRSAMTDRYTPSDAMLRAPRGEWPFSIVGAESRLAGSIIHYCWPNGQAEMESAPHEERVRRWWSLWTQMQGGRVGTMSFDPAVCFKRFNAGEASGQPVYQPARDGKPEMIRVPALMPAAIPSSDMPSIAFLRDDAPISKTPPTAPKGIAWIGVRWSAAGGCDIDLHARSGDDPTGRWLYFGSGKTEEGHFNKDLVSATAEGQYEFIEFVREIELSKAEVYVNIYSCDAAAPPEAVLRVWYSARIYEMPLKFNVRGGNRGAMPMTGPHWIKVDLRKVVGLSKG